MKTVREKVNEKTGNDLIEILQLKIKKNGRVDTTWGDKTPLGLALTVQRIIDNRIIETH